MASSVNQHDIDAARKQRLVDGKPLEQVDTARSSRCKRRDAVDAGAAQVRKPAPASRLSTCRISVVERVRIFVAAEREAVERRQARRHRRSARRLADRRILHHRRAGVELEPFRDIRGLRHPRDRARSACRDRTASARSQPRRASWAAACRASPRCCWTRARPRHRIHHGAKRRLRRQHLVGKPGGQFGNRRHRLSPHRAPCV